MSTTTNARGIVCSAFSVRALLAKRKWQTRRVLGVPDGWTADEIVGAYPIGGGWRLDNAGLFAKQIACPYGVVGDKLWVKEAIRRDTTGGATSHFVADQSPTKADAWPWKRRTLPSMFMPRALSRITLTLTDVRIERVQDITEADAVAEGCEPIAPVPSWSCLSWHGSPYSVYAEPVIDASPNPDGIMGGCKAAVRIDGARYERTAVEDYRALWDVINGKRAPWSSNPWVWVLTFTVDVGGTP